MADYTLQLPGADIDARLAKVPQLESALAGKQDTLVPGTNIKTINNESILGPGNIVAGDPNAVKYVSQTLTDAQKAQARTNIAAASAAELGQFVTDLTGIEADIESLESAVAAINVGDYVTATTLPTASASTMGHIYLIGPDANDNYDRYFTQESGGAYSWVSLGSTQIVLSTYATQEELGQLDAEVFGGEVTESSYIDKLTIANTNKYASTTADAGARFFPVTPGVSYKIVPQNGLSAIVAILKNIDNASTGNTPNFSDSYDERFILSPTDEFDFICPNDAHYVYMLDHHDSVNYVLAKMFILGGAIDGINNRLDVLESEVLPASTYVYQLVIDSSNLYKGTTADSGARFYPLVPGGKYKVTPQGGKDAIIAILKNIDVLTHNTSPAFSDYYTERIVLASTDEMEFICPDDAHYIYMLDYPDSQLYSLAKLTPSLDEQSIELLGMLDGKLNDTSDISVELDYGTVTGNKTSQRNLFDANGKPDMEADAASFHQYNSSNFIEAREYIEILDNSVPVGIIVMYDKDFNYVAQAKIEKQNILPSNVRFVKFCVANVGAVKSVTWSQGSVDTSGSETNRIRSNSVPLSDVGTVMFTKEMRLFLRFYDSNDTLIGNSLAQISVMNTRGMIEKAFAATVTGKTIADVSYMKFMAGETDNADLTTDSAPVIYLPGNPYIGNITIRTFGGRVVKDKNTYNTTFRLVYDTPVNHLAEDSSTTRYYSTLMLRLPKNYTQDGKPTRLIIFKSGSRSFDEIFEAEFLYVDYIKYWVDQGYAVMDYFGGTSKYPNNDSFGCATNIASANAAYNYLLRNFNIDNCGVYLSCKSLGGYTTHELLFNGTIPVKAAAMLAPGIDNKRYCFGYYGFQRLNFAADMGFTGDLSVLEGSDSVPRTDITIQYSDAFKTLLTNNIDKVYGYLPMFNGVINKTLAELLDLHTEVANAWADVKRIHRIPTRYWVAPDDTDTPYEIAENYVKSCQNAFSPVTLRTMPSGTGGHHSVDNATNAPKVASITTRLGVTYTNFPLAFVEALNFLERY